MAAQFHPDENVSLKDKVVVITGGAIGIGATTVRRLHSLGAHVYIGDVLDVAARELTASLATPNQICRFVHCDVASYADNLALFDTALLEHGHIDHAIAVAGLGERPNYIGADIDMESVKSEPKACMDLVDVNLKGPLYMARIAGVYLRQTPLDDKGATSRADKSLTFVSSVAAFREDPGLLVYTASKHGVMGLMRTLRNTLPSLPGPMIRTNTICPWMTRTRMARGIEDDWDASGLPANSADDIARHIVGVLADSSLNGEAIYVEGGRGWKLEERRKELLPQWVGERQIKDLDRGSEVLGTGAGWTKKQKA